MVLGILGLSLACTGAPPLDLRVSALDAQGQPAELWVRAGRVVPAGPPDSAPDAKVWIHGDRFTPGFVDAHGHPEGLGAMLGEADLSGCKTRAEALGRLRAAAEQLKPDAWLLGRGWDQTAWTDDPGAEFPTAAQLDAVIADRPVVLTRVDGHALWLNTAALQRAGMNAQTPDPKGGRILRDADGAPTGVLIDAAMDLIHAPEPTYAERLERLRRALDAIARAGLVGVHAMGVDDTTFAAMEELDRNGELKVRLWVYATADGELATRFLGEGPTRRRHLEVVGIKAFADGALGSRGALLSEDYSDEPGHRGLELQGVAELSALAERVLRAGGSFAVHAIGDRGVRNTLDALEPVAKLARMPPRIEHAQVIDPKDLPRFRALGVVASMQPTHATSDSDWAESRLGPARVRWAYAWRDVLNAGIPLAFGSDFPVEQVSPSYGLWSATTRLTRTDGSGEPWMPEQILTMDEAIDAFTSGPYRALGRAAPLLKPGDVADVTVWAVEDHGGHPWWTPIATIVDGEVVWVKSSS